MLKARYQPASVTVTDTSAKSVRSQFERAYVMAIHDLGRPIDGEGFFVNVSHDIATQFEEAVGLSGVPDVSVTRDNRVERTVTVWTRRRVVGNRSGWNTCGDGPDCSPVN